MPLEARLPRVAACSALLPFLGACSTLELHVDEPLDRAALESFEIGRTRRSEVLASLGPPRDLAAHANGCVFLYQSVQLDETQFGMGLKVLNQILPGAGLFKLSLGSSSADHNAAVLFFDAEGILSATSYGEWDEAFGRGTGLQFLFNVEQVIDSGTLRDEHSALSWGLLDVESLPAALNEPRRADVELHGTGTGAGQRSVE